jgi:hypothetical protein
MILITTSIQLHDQSQYPVCSRVLGADIDEEVLCTDSAFYVFRPHLRHISYAEWEADWSTLLISPGSANF